MKIILFVTLLITSQICASQTTEHTVYFNSGKSELNISEKKWLDSISNFLKAVSGYKIEIKAYCDADGSDESNDLLAKARANNINKIFLDNKLEQSLIAVNSFGENDPVADNTTTEGKAKNRRAEIKISYQKAIEKIIAEKKNENKNVDDNPANDLTSEKLEIGKTLVLKNLNFEGGTPVLLAESEPTLKALLKLMKENPTLEIEIGGHVCCGPDQQLSVLRAKKVYTYLVGYGIESKRMTYKGYSYDKPIASDSTPEGRTLNRRVEITIIKL